MESFESMQEEAGSLTAVVSSMLNALRTFTGESPYEPGTDVANLPTLQSVSELITLAVAVLKRDNSQERIRVLLSHEGPGVLEALRTYLVAWLVHVPGVTAEDQKTEMISDLRVLVLRSLEQIVSLTSYDDVPDKEALGLNVTCADLLAAEFERLQIPVTLVGIASGARHIPEKVKVAAAQCLYVYALRNEAGRADVVRVTAQLLQLMTIEKSATVRNCAAACIRECVNTHAREVEEAGFGRAVAQLAGSDGSTDVRIMVLETFQAICKEVPRCAVDPKLADVCIQLLASGGEGTDLVVKSCLVIDEVVEKEARRTAEVLAVTPALPLAQQPSEFTSRFVASNGVEALLRTILHHASADVTARAARTLRRVVQNASWRMGIARRIASSSLRDLLDLLIAAAASGSPEEQSAQSFREIALIEVAIVVCLSLAQSSDVRNQLSHIVGRGAEWCVAAREALLYYFDQAAMGYFVDMAVLDSTTGQRLNVLEGVEWSESGWPTRESVYQALSGVQPTGLLPQSMQYNMAEIQDRRMSRFTQVLLSYSAHLALSDDEDGHTKVPSPQRLSPEPPVLPPTHIGSQVLCAPPPPQWSQAQLRSASEGRRSQSRSVSRPREETRHVSQLSGQGGGGGGGGVQGQGQRQYVHSARSPPGPPAEAFYAKPPQAQVRAHKRPDAERPARRSTSQPLGLTEPRSRSASARGVSTAAPIDPAQFNAHDDALKFLVQYATHFSSSIVDMRSSIKGAPRWRENNTTNPWKPPTKKSSVEKRVWTVSDLKAGDLFMFNIPYDSLSVAAVERVLFAARKHQSDVKKGFLTTPQRAKGRRWCLFDLLNLVLPQLQHQLLTLAKLMIAIGEKETQVPIFMLREREIALGERGITPGTLTEVIEQLVYYNQVHMAPPDDAADVVAKLQKLARDDPKGYEDLSSSDSS